MGDYDEEYENFYYDDGRFEDQGGNDELDDSDIPTYDQLDIEGRYYEYGSREAYNTWRNKKISEKHAASEVPVDNKVTEAPGWLTVCVILIFLLFLILFLLL